MIVNGCTLYYIPAILAAVTYTLGAPTQDKYDADLDVDPLWLLERHNLSPPDAIPPPYYDPRRFDESMDDDMVNMNGDILPAPLKRETSNRIYEQSLPNMLKRGSLNDLIRRLNALRGNPNKKGTPRATMMRFGFAGKR